MLSPRRRQILEDLNVTHWVTRDWLVANTLAAAAAPRLAPQGTRPLQGLQAEPHSAPPPQPQTRPQSAAKRQRSTTAVASAHWPTVQCTWLAHWIFLGEPRTEPRVRRFLRDLLRAAAADTGTPQQLSIDAGELAQTLGAQQAQAALSAFVDKRVQAVQAQGLLLEASVMQGRQWLSLQTPNGAQWPTYQASGQQAIPVLTVPDLGQLMNDGAAKRQCWEQLQAVQALQALPTQAQAGEP